MRVVLDTNVIISALLAKESTPAKILFYWQEKKMFDIVVSQAILEEYHRAIQYPHIRTRHGLSDDDMKRFVSEFRALAILVESKEEVTIVTQDRDDNKFIACALTGRAELIISGDKDLLDIKSYRDVRIITPAIFLALLMTK